MKNIVHKYLVLSKRLQKIFLYDTINKRYVSENLCITDRFIKYVHEFKSVLQNRKCIYFERACQKGSEPNPRFRAFLI